MKIIIGLGNPGEKYEGTRHNIGTMITGKLAHKYNIVGRYESKFQALVGKGSIRHNQVLIVQPLTFMNLSGQSVSKALHWYKEEPSELLVIFDDINLALGRMRFRSSGSDGGHNGIKSIVENLGGFTDFPRLKVGIGPDPGGILRANYVLQEFSKQERNIVEKIIPVCIDGIEVFLNQGLTEACNRFNGINLSPIEE